MNNQILFEKIETYLKGGLSTAEQSAFEAEIASDESLQKLVQNHRKADEVSRFAWESSLRDRLKTLDAQLDSKEITNKAAKVKTMPLWRRLSVAASVLILIAAGLFIWQSNGGETASQDRLIASADDSEFIMTNQSSEKTKGTDEKPNLQRDMLAEADEAVKINDYASAIELYTQVLNIGEKSRLQDRAAFNLGIAYLRNGQKAEFKIQMQKIVDSGPKAYVKRAKELLKKHR